MRLDWVNYGEVVMSFEYQNERLVYSGKRFIGWWFTDLSGVCRYLSMSKARFYREFPGAGLIVLEQTLRGTHERSAMVKR